MPKVSVIVPVFGVEKYIERCARSLMEQTLEDMEFIFVDDSSPDMSMKILRQVISQYPTRKNQVKYLRHESNKGLPEARLTGLREASGEYIIHCDSDDYVDVTMYEDMYNEAIRNNLDIVVCDFFIDSDGILSKETGWDKNSLDHLRDILSWQWGGVIWNKMIRRELALSPSIIFPKDNHWEDLPQVVQYFLLSKSSGYVSKPLYYYCRRSDSIIGESHQSLQKALSNTVGASRNYDIVVNALKGSGMNERYEDITIRRQLFVKNQILKLMPFKGATKVYRDICRRSNFSIIFSRHISIKDKLVFLSAFAGIYYLIKAVKNHSIYA